MRYTINFKAWLAGPSKPRTSYDLYALWRASCGKSEGRYQASVNTNGHIVIVGPAQESLKLVSGRAIGAFKMALEGQKVSPVGLDVWATIEESNPVRMEIFQSPGGSKRFR